LKKAGSEELPRVTLQDPATVIVEVLSALPHSTGRILTGIYTLLKASKKVNCIAVKDLWTKVYPQYILGY